MRIPNDICRILDIEASADRKAIKKAYALKVKQYHPEEYPEEWERIHNAYEAAVRIVSTQGKTDIVIPEPEIIIGQKNIENKAVTAPTDEQGREAEAVFGGIEDSVRRQMTEETIKEMRRLTCMKWYRVKDWKAFFARQDILLTISRSEFLLDLENNFNYRKINNRRLLTLFRKQFERIMDYWEATNVENIGYKQDILLHLQSKMDTGFEKEYKFESRVTLAVGILLWILFHFLFY